MKSKLLNRTRFSEVEFPVVRKQHADAQQFALVGKHSDGLNRRKHGRLIAASITVPGLGGYTHRENERDQCGVKFTAQPNLFGRRLVISSLLLQSRN